MKKSELKALGERFLEYALNGEFEKVKECVKEGVELHFTNPQGETALFMAAIRGHLDVMDFLLNQGFDVNFVSGKKSHIGQTALNIACAHSIPNTAVVEFLLKHGADPNKQREGYGSALMNSAFHGWDENVELLLQHGAEPNYHLTGKVKQDALFLAAGYGTLRSVRLLVEAGSVLDRLGEFKMSPMMFAAFNGHFDSANYLLDKGADVMFVTSQGDSILDLTARHLRNGYITQDDAAKFTRRLLDLDVKGKKKDTHAIIESQKHLIYPEEEIA